MHTTTIARFSGSQPKPLGLVRIESPYPVLTVALKEILKEKAYVYEGCKPRGAEDPSAVVLCPNGHGDVVSEVRRLRSQVPGASVLVFAFQLDLQLVRGALRAGADGFVHAGMSPNQIVRTLRLASEGKAMNPKGLLEKPLAEDSATPDTAVLTARQREILKLVCEGLSNAQIGERLFLTESTIKQHLHAAYKLLGVRNRIQAAKLLSTV